MNIREKERDEGVKNRLLDTAEDLFCEKGFDAVSIRELTRKARCNIASVNYYYGGKENIYTEVFRRRLREMKEVRLASIERVMTGSQSPTLEELLRSYAEAFVEPMKNQSQGRYLMRLMMREMLDPHLPKGMLHDEMIGPLMTALSGAIRITTPAISDEHLVMGIHCFVAQLIHVIKVSTFAEETEDGTFPKFDYFRAVDNIVTFSAAGIRAFASMKE